MPNGWRSPSAAAGAGAGGVVDARWPIRLRSLPWRAMLPRNLSSPGALTSQQGFRLLQVQGPAWCVMLLIASYEYEYE